MTDADEVAVARFRAAPFERTPQRLDPLGVQSAWALVPALGAVAAGYALYSTLLHLGTGQVRIVWLAWVALALVVPAGVIFAIRARPGLAPLGRWSHLMVLGMVVVAACMFTVSVWGANQRIQDDWSQIVVALFLTAMPLFRPISEVVGAAVGAALVLGTVAAFEAPFLSIATSPLVYTTVAATPIIALACGGSGYAWTMTGETLAWREVARAGQARLDPELRETARRMVHQERITTLDEATLPFLADLLRRGEVTEDDARRAAQLADTLRADSVAAVNSTWLGETLTRALTSRGEETRVADITSRVSDPDRLERALGDERKAIVGAIIATVAKLPALDPGSVHITATDPTRPTFEITCRTTDSHRLVRREILPFVSALRSGGMEATMRTAGGELSVRFAYPGDDHR
ncbi:hypothetical protein [Leifsonia poae]|uniref:hypothetical protein n=1 Tax=Leifsonia poae TaxID=110933 RepID=UPI001CBD52CA|nr:hypothetical protein [Leifsonia poae]